MTTEEWLNIQDIFSIFIGPWIVIYMGVAVAGSLSLSLLSVLWRRVLQVQVIRESDDQ